MKQDGGVHNEACISCVTESLIIYLKITYFVCVSHLLWLAVVVGGWWGW